jgi:hypothetical protein
VFTFYSLLNFRKPGLNWLPMFVADCSSVCQPIAKPMCVSSEAAFVMRAGLSMGEVEQPSPSNRLYAALL